MNGKVIGIVLVSAFLVGLCTGNRLNRSSTEAVDAEPDPRIEVLENRIRDLEKRLSESRAPITQTVGQPEIAETQAAEASSSPVPDESSVPEAIEKKPSWRAAEKTISRIRDFQDLPRALQRTKIESFLTELQAVTPIDRMDETIEFLNGTFNGAMTSNSTVQSFEIELQAALQIRKQELRGRLGVKLSRNGKSFSRSNNNGHVQSIQRFSADSQAILISAGDHHFQLYHFPALDALAGNCYFQSKPGVFMYAGTVSLEKQRN